MVNIAVIGGGVVGITSALQVQKDVKNCRVTVFAEKISPNTTGDLSAGFWTPYLLEKTPPKDVTPGARDSFWSPNSDFIQHAHRLILNDRLTGYGYWFVIAWVSPYCTGRWSKKTHDELHKLWKEGHAEKAGICLLPVLGLFTEKPEVRDWYSVPYGARMLPEERVQKLSEQYKIPYVAAAHYVTYTCEPTKLLPMLMQQFLNNGGNLIRRKINNLSELSHYDVIVNCAGLEARRLVGDTELHAVRGQIIRVKAPWQFQVVSDESDKGYYIIPNTHYVILGGTHQVGNENLQVDPDDKEQILKGCTKVIPGLKTCTEHLDGVGLRPGRSSVRIDLQRVRLDGKTVPVVNNFGHGGAGVTLSFGCAEDASKLVQQALHTKSHL